MTSSFFNESDFSSSDDLHFSSIACLIMKFIYLFIMEKHSDRHTVIQSIKDIKNVNRLDHCQWTTIPS